MKNIAIIPNKDKDKGLFVTKRLIEEVAKNDVRIFVPEKIDAACDVKVTEYDRIFDDADFAIVVGGDGTILNTSHTACKKGIPILGVNLGRVGFMAEIEPDELEMTKALFDESFYIEERMMLDIDVKRDGKEVYSSHALNDAVISNGSVSKMVNLDVYCNEAYFTGFGADGVIVSTPTGSTAYSLSAGGAVVDPTMKCILVTPVCPHSFYNSRQVIFSENSKITIKDIETRHEAAYLTIDGRDNFKLEYGDMINVKQSEYTTTLVRFKNRQFYDLLYKKMDERR